MGLLLGIILPILLIILPIVALVIIGRGNNKKGRVRFVLAIIGCSLLGLVVPILATYLSVQGLMYNFGPGDPKCIIGAGVFLFSGYIINIIGLPIIGIAFFPTKHTKKI